MTHTATSTTPVPEYVVLARTLGGNGRLSDAQFIQNVFDYVRKNVEVEFRFGLGKGGRGAAIDQSGTPFDQAELMVKVLRQGGLSQVIYQVGTINLDAHQFGLWTGLVTGLDQSQQNFTVDAHQACLFLADGGIPATVNNQSDCSLVSGPLSAVTMAHIWVQVNGTNYDPSYKSHLLKSRIDISAAMQCGSDISPSCGSSLIAATTVGATPGTDDVGPYIYNSNQTNLKNQVQAQAVSLQTYIQTHDRLAKIEDIIGGSALSGDTPTSYTSDLKWPWADIPDTFRTTLRVRAGKNNIPTYDPNNSGGSDATYFADDISGKRLQVDPSRTNTEVAAKSYTDNCPTCIYGKVILDITHPYVAVVNGVRYGEDHAELAMPGDGVGSEGTYPITIVLGLGTQTSSTATQMAMLEEANPRGTSAATTTNYGNPATTSSITNSSYENTVQSIIASKLLSQGGRSDHIVEGLAQARITRHHVMGIVFARPSNPGGASFVNVQSAVSVNSNSASSVMRHPAFETQAAIWALLEGSAAAQGENADRGLTSALFLAGGGKIHLIAGWQSGYDGLQSSGGEGELLFNPTSVSWGYNVLGNVIKGGGSANGNPLYMALESTKFHDTSAERKKYLSVSPANGTATLKVTDLVTGTGSFPESLPFVRTYSSNSTVSDRSTSSSSSTCSYSGTDCTGGSGGATQSWQYSGPDSFANSHIGGGWTHNYNVIATASMNADKALGSEVALDASASIAALWNLIDIARNIDAANTAVLPSRIAMAQDMVWLSDRLAFNAVVVDKGGESEAFQRLPSGDFNSLLGSARLVQQGDYVQKNFTDSDFSSVRLQYTGKEGDIIAFEPSRWSKYPYDSATSADATVASPVFSAKTWSFPRGGALTFHYDGSFLLQSQRNGDMLVEGVFPYGYVLKSVTNNLGRTLSFDVTTTATFNVSSAMTVNGPKMVTLPSSYGITGVHDENGRQVAFALSNCPTGVRYACNTLSVTSPDQTTTKYAYNAADYTAGAPSTQYRLAAWYVPSDPNTAFRMLSYDNLQHVTAVADKLNHATTYYPGSVAGNELWKRSDTVDALGATTTDVFDQWNSLLSHTDANSHTWTNTYDNARRKLTAKNPEGDYISYDLYDVRSNLLSQIQHPKPGSPLAAITTSTTYMVGPTVLVTDAANCDLKTCNKPHYETNARGFNTYYGWKMNTGLLASVLSGMNFDGSCPYGSVCPRVDYDYVSQGGVFMLTSSVKTVDQTRSLTTTFTYNANNHYVLSTATVDPTGLNLTTSLTFDAVGNVTQVDGPRTDVSDISNYTWDNDRRLTMSIASATTDNGNSHARIATQYGYDIDGQLTQSSTGTTTTANGSDFAASLTVTNTYDAAGNKIKTVVPTGVTQFAYDGDDRVLCTAIRMNPATFGSLPSDACTLGTTGSYDADRITKNIYDPAGQLRQIVRGYGTSAQQVYQTAKYSANGKQIALADANGVSAIGVANADALNANAITQHQTNYLYDGFDRLIQTIYADGSGDQVTSYDNNNNPLTKVTRAGQTITHTYDSMDRMATKVLPAVSGVSNANTIGWTYDLTNQPTIINDTLGNVLASNYDLAGRLTSVTNTAPGLAAKTIGYGVDEGGNRTRVTWPDGYYVTYAYDAANRMTAANENGSTSLATFDYDNLGHPAWRQYGTGAPAGKVSYSWSSEGDLLTLTHGLAGQTHYVDFTDAYSPAHQIASSAITNSALQYVPTASGTTSYAANGLNQYSTVGGVNVGYDLNGNLTSDGNFAFGYDPENRLMTAAKSGTTVSYAYDPLGRRTSKVVNGAATYFLNSGDDEFAEYDGAGNLLRRFVPGPGIDQPIAMVTAAGVKTFFHQDKTGSVIAMTNADGSLAEGPYTYDPFGVGAPATGVPYKYTGRRLDPETGLYYYRARYYSAPLGRFLQTDSIGYKDDLNWYTYVGNDPTNRIDPTGLTVAMAAEVLTNTLKLDVVEEAAGGGPEDPVADIVAGVTTLAGLGIAAYELFQPGDNVSERNAPVAGTGKNAGRPQYGAVKPGQSGPAKVNRPTHGPKKSDAPKVAGRQGRYGGVIGSRGDKEKMKGRQDPGHNGGTPHGHPPEEDGRGHLWERPRNQ